MRKQSQVFWGSAIIVIGLTLLVGNLTGVRMSMFCWPTLFILLGVLAAAATAHGRTRYGDDAKGFRRNQSQRPLAGSR